MNMSVSEIYRGQKNEENFSLFRIQISHFLFFGSQPCGGKVNTEWGGRSRLSGHEVTFASHNMSVAPTRSSTFDARSPSFHSTETSYFKTTLRKAYVSSKDST